MKICEFLDEINTKGRLSNKEFIKNSMEIFKENIYFGDFYFKGKKVKIYKHEEGLTKCFEKFVIGADWNHNYTDKIDKERISKIMWIKNILENYEFCKNKICNGTDVYYYQYKCKMCYAIVCKSTNFTLFLDDYSDKNYYLLTSAYTLTDRKRKEIEESSMF